MERIYLTKEGYDRLIEEVEQLKKKRKEISAALAHARSMGDISENAEYDAAKEAVAKNEHRIRELQDKLSRVEFIDNIKVASDAAYIGAKVTLIDLETDEECYYRLVGTDEADPVNDLISITSPVGKAILGKKIGDTLEIEVPAGVLKYKIVGISR